MFLLLLKRENKTKGIEDWREIIKLIKLEKKGSTKKKRAANECASSDDYSLT